MLATTLWRDPLLADLRWMDEVFTRLLPRRNGDAVTGFMPLVDVRESEEHYIFSIDLPGVKREDVSIELQDNVLTISGVRTPDETGDAVRVERPFGSFMRSLTLPQGVDADGVVADYHEGVLELRVAKPAGLKRKRIEIGGTQKALTG